MTSHAIVASSNDNNNNNLIEFSNDIEPQMVRPTDMPPTIQELDDIVDIDDI
jgi:Fe-S-cluster formation regulator IscX/YfhJ